MGALQDIIDLYGRGGIEVTTFAGSGEEDAESNPLIRTVIQPNASLITWVRPGDAAGDALDKHYGKLQSHLKSLKDLRRRLNAAGWFLTIISILLFYGFSSGFDVSQIIRLLLVSIGVLLFRVLYKYLISVIFRRYIRRKLQKYFSPSTL